MPTKRTASPRHTKGRGRKRGRTRSNRVEPQRPELPERPAEDDGEGLNIVLLLADSTRRNTHARRKNPSIEDIDLPDLYVLCSGGPRTPGAPIRLSVPELGCVIVDPELATLATEGKRATETLATTPALRAHAEKYAARLVGITTWTWARPRADRAITSGEKKAIRILAELVADRVLEELDTQNRPR